MGIGERGLGKQVSEQLGLPEGFNAFSPYPFSGMNQLDDRIAIDDKQFFVLENYIKVGNGYLRTLWDQGPALYTAPTGLTIVKFHWFNIGPNQYCAVFLSDGTAVQVSTSGIVTPITLATGTFYKGGNTPSCTQWGTKYLLISSNISANAYWAWDGSILYTAGSISPLITINGGGSAYSSTPTVTPFGGAVTGLSATAVVTNGAVTSLTVINPGQGYVPGDVVQFAFSGGGSDTTPILQAVFSGGVVQFVNVLAGGSGYTLAPGVTFTGGGGTGAAATATISGGAVTSISVTSGGSGYTSSPAVGFTGGGGGSGAQGAAYLTSGTVSAVNVINSGSGFRAVPSLSFSGGGGTGAAATVVLSGGSTGYISSVTITTGGSGYTSAPAVVVSPGQNNSAYATAALMPFVVNGYAVETFQSRVWLANTYSPPGSSVQNGGVLLTSAPGSLSDFATSDGGNNYNSNEPFLRVSYQNLKQAQGYLYTLGDSATDVISNVQTTGSPSTTTFTYANVDPQTGAAWRDTTQYFGLSVLFANDKGAFGLYGGAVKLVSKPVLRLFDSAIFPPDVGAVVPSSAVADIHTIKCYLINMTILDPNTGNSRTVMLVWDETDWFLASQSSQLTYIGTQTVNSSNTAWGTDGKSLFALFGAPSSSLTKTFSTKLFGADSFPVVKQGWGLWMMAGDVSANKSGVVMTATIDTEAGSYATQVSPLSFGGFPILATEPGNNWSILSGVTAKSSSPDFVLKHLVIGYQPVWGGYGSPPIASGQ